MNCRGRDPDTPTDVGRSLRRLINRGVGTNDGHIIIPFNVLFTINRSNWPSVEKAAAPFDAIIAPHLHEWATAASY